MSYICTIQLSTLPMNDAKLDYYARICDKKNTRLILLGEYVLNNFFKELELMPKNMIKEQSNHKIKMLQNICKKYNLTIVAPIVKIENKKASKYIIKASAKSIRYYPQYFYINYKHWNEEKFFHQEKFDYSLPTFTHEGLKYGIMFGYEVHFDYIFSFVDAKKIDVLLLPSACSFDSSKRWEELLKTRAFTHNIYILRANRIGDFKHKQEDWNFYGKSMLIDPHGQIQEYLNNEEALMIAKVQKSTINEARNLWGWKKIMTKKGLS